MTPRGFEFGDHMREERAISRSTPRAGSGRVGMPDSLSMLYEYPYVELTDPRTKAFDVALDGCFSERARRPKLFR